MRDKAVVQLLERTVDILMLRGGNAARFSRPGITTEELGRVRFYSPSGSLLQKTKKTRCENYITDVLEYIRKQIENTTVYQDVKDAYIQLFNLLSLILRDVDWQEGIVNTGFESKDMNFRELLKKIKQQLGVMRDFYLLQQYPIEISDAEQQFDVVLALLVHHGLAT